MEILSWVLNPGIISKVVEDFEEKQEPASSVTAIY